MKVSFCSAVMKFDRVAVLWRGPCRVDQTLLANCRGGTWLDLSYQGYLRRRRESYSTLSHRILFVVAVVAQAFLRSRFVM